MIYDMNIRMCPDLKSQSQRGVFVGVIASIKL